MRLIYFDETKFSESDPFFFIGGILLPGKDITVLEDNTLILWLRQSNTGFETSQWVTFLQVKKLGGKVKKGERATQIVFYKKLVITDKESEEEKTIPLLKTHAVFNLSQTEGFKESY